MSLSAKRIAVSAIFVFLLVIGMLFLNATDAATALPSAGWVSLDTGQGKGPSTLSAVSVDELGLTVTFTLPGFELGPVQLDGETWDKLSIQSGGILGQQGAPDLPVLRKMFAVPATGGVSIRVGKVQYQRFDSVHPAPAQRLLLETESRADAIFSIDDALYETDALFPTTWADARIAGVMHSVRLAQLEIHPFRYNPVTGELFVASRMEVVVEFNELDDESQVPYAGHNISAQLRQSLKRMLLNPQFVKPSMAQSGGDVDYLIVVDQALASAQSLADLVDYHEGQGRNVEVVDTATTGTTADQVKAVIQAEYDSISPPQLDYVLIVADVAVIPFKDSAFGYNDSDAWYGWLEGDDIFTDVGLGRFPANDEGQLDAMIDKTLNFHNEIESGEWLSKSLLIAHREYFPEKYTACKQSIYEHEFTLDAPLMDRLYGGDSQSEADNDDVIAAIEDGRAVVNYRGHGDEVSWTGWSWQDEYFTTSHARGLANGNKTPIVFSIACLNLNMMASNSETLGEAFMRHDQGAVAFLGAIHPSYTDPNHHFDRSLYYGAWDHGITAIGDLLAWANVDLYNTYCTPGETCWGEDNIAMYLWLGDPALNVPVSGLKSPTNLTATGLSTTEIELAWTDRTDEEDGYIIERKQPTDVDFVELATTGVDAVAWTDTGLSECGTYVYRVRAFMDQDQFSKYSDGVTTQTLGAPPSNLDGIGTGIDQNTLTWTDATDGEQGFTILRKDPGKAGFDEIHTTGQNVTEYVDESLEEGTVYEYQVATTTLGGDSEPVGPVAVITLPAAPDSLAHQVQSDNTVKLSWTDRSGGEQGFRVFRADHGQGNFEPVGTSGANEKGFSDPGLAEASTFDYYVCAYNDSGDGPPSETISVLSVPAPPLDLTVKPVSTSQVHLFWTDSSQGEQGIRIERDMGEGFGYLAQVFANGQVFHDTGMTEGTLVAYRLFAFNQAGDSVPGQQAQTRTMPTAPTDLEFELNAQGAVTLIWSDNSKTEQGYYVERRTPKGDFAQIGRLAADATSFEEDDFPSETGAIYRVSAFNEYTDSEFTNSVEVLPGEDETSDKDRDLDDSSSGQDDEQGCGC